MCSIKGKKDESHMPIMLFECAWSTSIFLDSRFYQEKSTFFLTNKDTARSQGWKGNERKRKQSKYIVMENDKKGVHQRSGWGGV